jgi:hypothetical protein
VSCAFPLALIAALCVDRPVPTRAPTSPQDAVVYTLEPLPPTPGELDSRFSPERIALLEKLNRRDREHLVRPDPPAPGLVVPSAFPDDELRLAPLPETYAWSAPLPKAIVVHQPMQVFGAYERGRLVRWGPVSTGRRENPTPHGVFNLTWKSKQRRSTDNEAWLLKWYFNFINARGVSFHQFDLPGYAASHACVRLLERDAEWLYGWGEQWRLDESGGRVLKPGTTVVVIGAALPGAPWTSLDRLRRRIDLPPLPFWILMPGLSFR